MNKLFTKIATATLGFALAIGAAVSCISFNEQPVLAASTATMKYTGTTTGNLSASGNASKLNLDSTLFTVNSTATGSNYPGVNKDGSIRLYSQGNSSSLGHIEIIIADGYVIDSLNFTYTGTSYSGITLITGASTITGASSVTTETLNVNQSSVKLTNKKASGQVRIKTCVITYSQSGSELPTSLTLSGDLTKTNYTTFDLWDATGLVATEVYSSGNKDVTGETNFVYSPATPDLYYSSNATELKISFSKSGLTSNVLTISGISVTPAKGSIYDPYTVTEAYEIASALAVGTNNGRGVYVEGKVTGEITVQNSSYGTYNFNITDGTSTLKAYSIPASVDPTQANFISENYTVVVGGAIINYNGTLEVGYQNGVAEGSLVSVKAPELGQIDTMEISTEADVTTFEVGQTFSSEGLILTVVDVNGLSVEIASGYTTNFDGHVFTEEDLGTHLVHVAYLSVGISYEIEVIPTVTYTKVQSLDDLQEGDTVIIAAVTTNSSYFAAVGYSSSGTTYLTSEKINGSGNTVSSEVSLLTFEVNFYGEAIGLKNDGKYLSWSSGNSAALSATTISKAAAWTVTSGVVKNLNDATRILQYNTSSPRFACYTGSQVNAGLYVASNNVHSNETVVETFVNRNLHMRDVAANATNSGLCTTSGWYEAAKTAYTNLTDEQKDLFATATYTNAAARLSAWAIANGETFDVEHYTFATNSNKLLVSISNDNSTIILLAVSFSLLTLSVLVVIDRKRRLVK